MPKKSGKKPVKIKRQDGKTVKIGKKEPTLVTKKDGTVDVIMILKKKKGKK